jgi:hypothetical protein
MTQVTFGGVEAPAPSFFNDTTILIATPAGTGTVDVRVTTIGGTSAIVAEDVFTYVPVLNAQFTANVTEVPVSSKKIFIKLE